SLQRFNVDDVVHYTLAYLHDNPSHERYVVREFAECFRNTYVTHLSIWNDLISSMAFQKKHIDFFSAFFKVCSETIILKDLATPIRQLLAQTEPIETMFLVRAHLSKYMATQSLKTFCRESSFAMLFLSEYGQHLAQPQFVQFSQHLDAAILGPLRESMAISSSSGASLDPPLLFASAEAVLLEILRLPFTNDFKAFMQMYRSELRSFLQRQSEPNLHLVEDPGDILLHLEEVRKLEEKYFRSLIFLYIVNPFLTTHYVKTDNRSAAIALSRVLQSLANAEEGELLSSHDPHSVALHLFCQKNLPVITGFLYNLSADSTSSSSGLSAR
ncbi:MAG: hypothetical protein V4492_05150, partial [Chlamydiota bacterium]